MDTVLTASPVRPPPPPTKERELQDDLNVIIFSDHGMTDISWIDKVIELYNYINLRDLQQVKGRGPIMSLWPAPGKHSEVRRVGGGPSRGGRGWGCLCWVFVVSRRKRRATLGGQDSGDR